ncbi:SPFH domain-containing protein [Iningainema tapete]|uniref:Flotillin family protein n=1 Tax=Iningainema tapete BLCC-T55 TaxID=2748662 RepID=A0A8J7C869_9CYAN|nr:flotillin family protein [Iningainema tapete]MBD2776639.1 flotillin family protein [Iningainema tapete BLCC-T55]
MKSSQDSLGARKQNKILRFAASFVTTLALAGSIHSAGATPIKTDTVKQITSVSVQGKETQPTIAQLKPSTLQSQIIPLPWGIVPIFVVGGLVIFVPLVFGGLVVIGEREVGVVVKKFAISGRGLPAGRLIALNGEAGLQADTLTPGWHWGYWPWQYSVRKEQVVVVPQGEIALLVAADGASNPPERILGKIVDCDNFQDARKFLTAGGEKGRQMGFLTAGTYRINTALFKVIMAGNASAHGMSPEQLRVYTVDSDKVGIVTTLDGLPIPAGEIAGPMISGHDNFQNGQRFIDGGERRGLQEQILLSGSWNLNPWLVQVEQVRMTEIPIGYVGVVISFVGKAHEDVSGAAFTHGNLVNTGHKGVWVEPLYPGKHPVNTRVMKIELVPTTNIVLNWSGRTERHSYDAKLESLTVRSRDGFAFDLEVAQIIHVGALDAPKVISRVGSMQNLVDHVLEPTIGNYFRNSAQDYTVLDFLCARSERQAEASGYIKTAIRAYDVQAIDTLIGDIQPPATLMQTQTDRKIAEEQRKTYEVQQLAQTQRQQLVRETALAEIQQEMVKSEQGVMIAELKAKADIQQETVKSEQGVKISELKASAKVKEMTGEAESIRLRAIAEAESMRLNKRAEAEAISATGNAKAEAYRAGVEALGSQGYTAMQLMQIIGDRNVRLIPDVLVGGNNGSTNGLVDGLLSMILWNQTAKPGDIILPLQQKPTTTPQSTPSNGNQPVVVDFPLDNNVG